MGRLRGLGSGDGTRMVPEAFQKVGCLGLRAAERQDIGGSWSWGYRGQRQIMQAAKAKKTLAKQLYPLTLTLNHITTASIYTPSL